MPDHRIILHVDMDAFFASVEVLDNSALAGKPILVGGTGPRSVVAAASYEARKFGCHSAQPMSIALRRCPHAVVVKPKGGRYSEVSKQVFTIFETATPRIQPLSIDEAFLDVTGSTKRFEDGIEIARTLKKRIKDETKLCASIGVAPNKLVAKIASDMDKPDGLTVVAPGEVEARLGPLPVERLWGVGPKTAQNLHRLGVRTFEDLRGLPRSTLGSKFGELGESLYDRCRGIDDRPVHADTVAKSISNETTFGSDLESPDQVRAVLADLSEQVARRLRAKERKGRTVSIKVRFGEFQTITRARTLDLPTDRTDELAGAARALFDEWAKLFRPVRLIGMGVSQLTDPGAEQLELFEAMQDDKQRAIDRATDEINAKFGKRSIRRGGAMGR